MLLTIISIGHLCVFLYCIVCFKVLIQLLAATVNKWCYYNRNNDLFDTVSVLIRFQEMISTTMLCLFILSYFPMAHALQCFSCSSPMDRKCGDFGFDNSSLPRCSDGEVCVKIGTTFFKLISTHFASINIIRDI